MTMGTIMFFGGIAGTIIALILLLTCLISFPKKRSRFLEQIIKDDN